MRFPPTQPLKEERNCHRSRQSQCRSWCRVQVNRFPRGGVGGRTTGLRQNHFRQLTYLDTLTVLTRCSSYNISKMSGSSVSSVPSLCYSSTVVSSSDARSTASTSNNHHHSTSSLSNYSVQQYLQNAESCVFRVGYESASDRKERLCKALATFDQDFAMSDKTITRPSQRPQKSQPARQ